MLRQLSYAIKNQLGHPKPPTRVFACPTLVLYGIRAPIIGPFSAWKPPIPYAMKNQRTSRPMRAEPRHSSTNESGPACCGVTSLTFLKTIREELQLFSSKNRENHLDSAEQERDISSNLVCLSGPSLNHTVIVSMIVMLSSIVLCRL